METGNAQFVLDNIRRLVNASDVPANAPPLQLTGSGCTPSYFAVSDFAQAAIAVAVSEVQILRRLHWGITANASVDRALASAWCKNSVYPVGWERPATWDVFAGDYLCTDGWIRLHTNAKHHRQAALAVLRQPTDKSAACASVRLWKAADLESAVVNAGGAAARMMSQQAWLQHPQGQAVSSEPVIAWSDIAVLDKSPESSTVALNSASRPLLGLRVLDLTRVLAGPVCTRFLAALGADVLRIDPPHWQEDGNALEMTIGKRCAGLDLTRQTDRDVFDTLISQCDVLVHGYRSDALAGLGYDDATIAGLNPQCINVALNAYGWTGPWVNRRGFDSLVQMSTGIAHYGQQAGQSQTPVPLPFQALDHVTGYLMAAAVVHAVRQRHCHGRVLAARLSLARQAMLLWELCGPDSVHQHTGSSIQQGDTLIGLNSTRPAISEEQFNAGTEQTPWGPVRRLALPFSIDGVTTQFDHPSSTLRSSIAQW